MWDAFKRLVLGLVLITLAAAVLLVSDWQHRKPKRAEMPRVALFQFATRPLLEECMSGVLQGLSAQGFVAGQTMQLQRFNAENDLPTANGIARTIVAGDFKMVITISTLCLQTMASANTQGKVIHVFGAVTDPSGSGVGISQDDPLSHPKHLVGVGTFQPVKETFRLARRLYPELRVVGEVWNPVEACSDACTRLAREVCSELGIELLEAHVDSSAAVAEAAESLVSRGAQALWVGGDNTVEMAINSVIRAGQKARIPVIGNGPTYARLGALLGLGADYREVGRVTGDLAAQVLKGLDPASVPIRNVLPQYLSVNLSALVGLRDPWRVPQEVLASAGEVVDEKGVAARPAPLASPVDTAPEGAGADRASIQPGIGNQWRIHFVNFVEATHVETAHAGFFDQLKESGLVEGRDYEMKLTNAQGDMATLVALIDAALGDHADLILLTSTPTLQVALRKVRSTPLLFTNVASPVMVGAGRSDQDHLPHVTGVYTMSNFAEMVRVVRECLPHARRIGTLFVPAEVNSVLYKEALSKTAATAGLEVVAVPVSTSSEVIDASLTLTRRQIDAVCQIADNLGDAAFAGISQAALKEKVPLFCFVSDKVKAGSAAVAVARDYSQGGRDLADITVRVMRGESPARIPFRLVSKTKIAVNLDFAAQCGLTVPESLLSRADEVIGKSWKYKE